MNVVHTLPSFLYALDDFTMAPGEPSCASVALFAPEPILPTRVVFPPLPLLLQMATLNRRPLMERARNERSGVTLKMGLAWAIPSYDMTGKPLPTFGAILEVELLNTTGAPVHVAGIFVEVIPIKREQSSWET